MVPSVKLKLRKTLLLLAAAAAAFSAPGTTGPDLAPDAGADALRQIVQNQCVLNWTQHNNPAPCERVSLADAKSSDSGYAVLADPGGGAHYLLIPTQTMAGIESGGWLHPDP